MAENETSQTRGDGMFRTPAGFDFGAMFAANQTGMQALAQTQQQMMRGITRMNGEMLDFVNRRLENDRAAMREMAGCKTVSEALSVYSRFLQGMMKDYTEEATTLAGMCAEQARESVGEMQARMRETTEALGDSARTEPDG